MPGLYWPPRLLPSHGAPRSSPHSALHHVAPILPRSGPLRRAADAIPQVAPTPAFVPYRAVLCSVLRCALASALERGPSLARCRLGAGVGGRCQAVPTSSTAGFAGIVCSHALCCVIRKKNGETVCCKSMLVFQIFQRYVGSVVYRFCKSRVGMLHML